MRYWSGGKKKQSKLFEVVVESSIPISLREEEKGRARLEPN